jgi:hypothetical protein
LSDAARTFEVLGDYTLIALQELEACVEVRLNAAAKRAALTRGEPARVKSLGEEVALEAVIAAERRASAEPPLSSVRQTTMPMVGGVEPDEARERLRLRDDLEDAAGQLRELPELGIIVLDTTADARLCARGPAILEMLRDESWAERIELVIVVKHTYPGFSIAVVPGRNAQYGFWRQDFPGLRMCEKGHSHVDTFGLSKDDCGNRRGRRSPS